MFSKLSVIIVEDEPELLENLMIGLSGKGFQVCGTNSGTVLNQMLSEQQADIIVLDIGLPGEDGISIARRVQQTHPSCGIIMVTAHGATHDITNGLQNGADNYFVKPVNIEVLAMSIRSLARRLNKTNKTAWVLHCESSSLRTPRGIKVNLTALECILLKRLMGQTGTNVHRSEI